MDMQEENLNLRSLKIGCLPIIDVFIERMGLKDKLAKALSNSGYAEAVIILLKNILTEREAMYAVRQWAFLFDLKLDDGSEIGDDRLGRALDRLFGADRATLQTEIVLKVIKAFDLKMGQIHNDTTSISAYGAYESQDAKAIKLKRGHSKDHRPDLKQLVYSLCVTRDGAVPVHFKCYDGNRTDDTIQLETWNSIRVLLQTPNFVYVGDSKLCVEESMRKIDGEHGFFVTMVPRTRAEVAEFAEGLGAGNVIWERCLRKRFSRTGAEFDTFDVAQGHYQLREGFRVFWFKSSQKRKRDAHARAERIQKATRKLESMDLRRLRGPKTESTIRTRIDGILARYHVGDYLRVEIEMETEEEFKALARGRPTLETKYRRVLKKAPCLKIDRNAEAITRAQLMDGIFPLTTNTKEKALEVLKIYKYQPTLEKRHSLLKSTFEVAPMWLKKNSRIEALMFVEYLAQMVAALIERELRNEMVNKKIDILESLPEGRPSKTPTFEQLLRLFENRHRHELLEKNRPVKVFTEPLTKVQDQILTLLQVAKIHYVT